uniref:Uncharacterized protein n=1 Tax=Rhizophora mucronata TaxID=61149 RepID=A0A2P2KRS6_RHIMU
MGNSEECSFLYKRIFNGSISREFDPPVMWRNHTDGPDEMPYTIAGPDTVKHAGESGSRNPRKPATCFQFLAGILGFWCLFVCFLALRIHTGSSIGT